MNMRITGGQALHNYRSNLSKVTNQYYNAQNKTLTLRAFNSYAEDPASATQAFKLRREFSRTNDHLSNTNTMLSKFDAAWSTANSVKDLVQEAAKEIALRGENAATGAGRETLGQLLSTTADSIVQALNVKYGDSYTFAGTDGNHAPFSWDESSGALLFRGIPVDSDKPDDQAKLKAMAEETLFIDVGSGLTINDDGSILSATAFNGAISGLNLLGFGLDDQGDPLNAVSLIKALSEVYSRCDPTSGDFADDADKALATKLTQKLDTALSSLTNEWIELDGKAGFLEGNKSRLEDHLGTLNEQIIGVEKVELADALTEYMWAQYCYNAALKIGESIISPSLLDYMR